MIREVEGDILLSKAQVIAHGVAPNDHFDNGLALALRTNWPAMVKDFRHFCQERHPKAGGIWFWWAPGGQSAGVQGIVNLLTQEGIHGEGVYDHGGKPGRATLAHVHHALKSLAKFIRQEGIRSVALPRLATGVGGLDWAAVKPFIDQHLGNLGIPVFVYNVYRKDVAAMEPGIEPFILPVAAPGGRTVQPNVLSVP